MYHSVVMNERRIPLQVPPFRRVPPATNPAHCRSPLDPPARYGIIT
jgi:hypothetical protein